MERNCSISQMLPVSTVLQDTTTIRSNPVKYGQSFYTKDNFHILHSCKYFQSPTQRTIHILVLNVVCHNVGMYCYITMIAVSKYCVYCKSIKLFVLKFLSKTRRYVHRSDSFGQRAVTCTYQCLDSLGPVHPASCTATEQRGQGWPRPCVRAM